MSDEIKTKIWPSIKFLNTKQKFYYKLCAAVQLLIREGCICKLTFYLPEALSWQVKVTGIRQSTEVHY